MHEVVVRNRLEQLRKRQRDEALVAQEELLAGRTKKPLARAWGGDMHAVAVQEIKDIKGDDEEVPEVYDRSMSPTPIDMKRLSYEERQLPVISEEEHTRTLVGLNANPLPLMSNVLQSLSAGATWHPLISSLSALIQSRRLKSQ